MFLAVALLFSMLPQAVLSVNATELQKGDGWGNWSDYVLEDTVVIYPVEGGNIYLGQEDWAGEGTASGPFSEIDLLSADSTVNKIVIPSSVNGLPVTTISEFAFHDCSQLTYVEIPATIEYVWGTCFMGCSNLKEVRVADGNPNCYSIDGILYTKGFNQWTNSSTLTLEVYPAAKEDEQFAVPDGVTSISQWAFGDAVNLRSISIPNSVTNIQSAAFGDWYSNVNFTEIYFESSETRWKEILVGGEYGYDTIESTLIHFNKYEPFDKSTGNDSTLMDGKAIKDKYGVSSQEQFVSCLGTDIQPYPASIYGIVSMVAVDLNDDSVDELIVLRVSEKDNKDEAQIIAEVYQGTNGYMLSDSQSVYSVAFCAAANLYLFYSDVLGEYCLMIESYSSGSYTGVSSWEAEAFTITEESIESYAYWAFVPSVGIYADFEEELKAISAPYAKYCTEYENLDNGLFYQPLCEIEHETYGDTSSYSSRNHKLTIKSISGIKENAVEDYARTEWIKQHMEYANSDEYDSQIISGYGGRMLAVFRDALDDGGIQNYRLAKNTSRILGLDIEFSEKEMYELILAEILYSKAGLSIGEEAYKANYNKSLQELSKLLVTVANVTDNSSKIPKDAMNSIQELYSLIQTMNTDSADFKSVFSQFVKLIDENVKRPDLVKGIKSDATFTALGIVVDGLFEEYDALEDIVQYMANYTAYQSTSRQLKEVLMRLSVVVLYEYQGLAGVGELEELGLWDAMVNWSEFSEAIISFMKVLTDYEQEGAAAVATYAVERMNKAEQNFDNKAFTSILVFGLDTIASQVPILNALVVAKNVLNVGVLVTEVISNVDEREYALDMLTKIYCISFALDKAVNDCASAMTDDDFYASTVFDESVSIYSRAQLLASDYALKYADMVLVNARQDLYEYDNGSWIEHLFHSREEMVAIVEWYSNSYKMLEEQRTEIQSISCHDSDLQYDSLNDEITYNFKDSRIYVVACPVDVIVTNESGEQIAYLSGEENEILDGYEFYFHTIKIPDDSGEYIKVAIVPNHYRIEMKGTDDGVMHAFVADFTTDDVGEVETYFNIPIEKDSEGYFEASTEDTNTSCLVMDQAAYSNMESVEDIPTDSEKNSVWIWTAGGVIASIMIVFVILKKKSRK